MSMGFRVMASARLGAAAIAMAVVLGLAVPPVSAAGAAPAVGNDSVAQAQPPASDVNDPLEPVNRAVFSFNEFIYALIIRPIADAYVLVIPDEARDGIRNVLVNVKSPVVLANDLLQGDFTRAWQTTERMFINTTVGVGGLFDVAKMWGIEGHSEDLGQTLAVWGVPDPFYLVLPVLGPSSPRDAVGEFADSYLDPLGWYLSNIHHDDINYGRDAMLGVDTYSRVMDDLQKLKDT
jgi:phospholipid-binding lipoprotein MlaA